MTGQRTENLFRRYKGQRVNVRTVSGGIYEGEVIEVTNDYVSLSPREGSPVFVFFDAVESVTVMAEPEG